jgi:hypothetical protein
VVAIERGDGDGVPHTGTQLIGVRSTEQPNRCLIVDIVVMLRGMSKHSFSGFVSYAHADRRLVEAFLELARPRLLTRPGFEASLWSDRHILVGQEWEREIERALDDADFGMLCVSASLMASPYVQRVELPALLVAERMVVPLALEPIDHLHLDRLAGLQIYRLLTTRGTRPLSFQEARRAGHAKTFCDQLLMQIGQRLLGKARGRVE